VQGASLLRAYRVASRHKRWAYQIPTQIECRYDSSRLISTQTTPIIGLMPLPVQQCPPAISHNLNLVSAELCICVCQSITIALTVFLFVRCWAQLLDSFMVAAADCRENGVNKRLGAVLQAHLEVCMHRELVCVLYAWHTNMCSRYLGQQIDGVQ
jgi:hypothetical protein